MSQQQNRDEILSALRQFKQHHAEQYSILRLGIFGSFARDEAQPDSDVDIVFETSEPNLFCTASMGADLQDLLGRRVDVVRLRERMNPNLKESIMRDAVYV